MLVRKWPALKETCEVQKIKNFIQQEKEESRDTQELGQSCDINEAKSIEIVGCDNIS